MNQSNKTSSISCEHAHEDFMQRAIELSCHHLDKDSGGPFGAVITRNGEIIAEGFNQVTGTHDPTAHAEIVAIRKACDRFNTFDLSGCEIYSSCEPCPMCLSAIYWARLDKIYYANSRQDAAQIGFDDEFLYQEVCRPVEKRKIPTQRLLEQQAKTAFELWQNKDDKTHY